MIVPLNAEQPTLELLDDARGPADLTSGLPGRANSGGPNNDDPGNDEPGNDDLDDGAEEPLRRPGGRRIGAWLIDAVVYLGIMSVADLLIGSLPLRRPLFSIRWTYVVVFTIALLSIAVPAVAWCRTIGKAALGLRIETVNGGVPTVRQRLIRAIVACSPLWIVLVPWPHAWWRVTSWLVYALWFVIAVTTLFGQAYRGLPDQLAGTVVRRVPAPASPASASPRV